MKESSLEIQQVSYDTIPYNGFIELVGKRGSGKSSWARYICSQLPDCKEGIFIVMTTSESVKSFWSTCIPALFIVEPSVSYLASLKERQNKLISHFMDRGLPFPRSLHVTLILDDCASIRSLMRSPELSWLASNGRHIQLPSFS